jgi:BolA protein
MIEAQPAERRRTVAAALRPFHRRRAELARFGTARPGANTAARFYATMKARRRAFLSSFVARHTAPFSAKTSYIGAMDTLATAPPARRVKDLIEARLADALKPDRLVVTNDSHLHSGHMGDDGSGESHFSVEIESSAFVGLSRVARQRLVNTALADLLRDRIHALAIRARAPGDA